MNNKTEGTLASIAAIVVLFTSMIDPWISIGVSFLCLVALSIYHFIP